MTTNEPSSPKDQSTTENKNEEHTSFMAIKTPIVIFHNRKQNVLNESTRLLFPCSQSNLSSIFAFAQANLVQQTQQDILKMFSTESVDSVTIREVDSSQKKDPVIIKTFKSSKLKEEQHICDVKGCGRVFASQGHVKNHQLIHQKERDLQCHFEGCGRKFSWPAHLKYHLLTHEKTRNFKCSIEGCDKTFVTGQQLKVHSRTHTGEKPFKCDQCQKAFTTAGNLKNHIRTHTGDKPYECPEPKCHLRFAEYSSLKKHSLIHTGEKPFKCAICDKSFTQSGSMRVHMKKHIQNGNSSDKETQYDVVMMEENSPLEDIDYQVVYSDSVTDNVVTVTTENSTNESLPVSNEMFLVEELFTDKSRVSTDSSSPANVVVVPLPQLPVSMATSYQNIQTTGREEIVMDKNEFLHSDLDHEEIAYDIPETEH